MTRGKHARRAGKPTLKMLWDCVAADDARLGMGMERSLRIRVLLLPEGNCAMAV